MSRILHGATIGAVLLLGAAACTPVEGETQDEGSGQSENGYGDLYYVARDGTAGNYTSRLLRWDGTEGGEVETVAEVPDLRLFNSAAVSSDGAFAAYGNEDMLKVLNLKSGKGKSIVEFPEGVDECRALGFAPDSHEVAFSSDGKTKMYDVDSGEQTRELPVSSCHPLLAEDDSGGGLSQVHLASDGPEEILVTSENGESVDTDLYAKITERVDIVEVLFLSTVSPNGSQLCASGTNEGQAGGGNPYARSNVCEVLVDVATGDFVKEFGGQTFTVRYTGQGGALLRHNDELGYYESADDLSEPTQTLKEPAELAEAELLAVTDA